VNWLRAQGLDARLRDDRNKIMTMIQRCRRVDKQLSTSPLQPIVGDHNAFNSIKSRLAGNENDNWNSAHLDILKQTELITDDVVDRLLGSKRMSRPSIRHRVMNLVCGGHFHPKSIQCRNVESSNGMDCVLVVCECLSSKTNVVHKTYAVFEDKPDGEYQIDLSSCTCKKGEYFCSHLIGFLYLVSIFQHKVQTQSDFENAY